MLKPNNYDNVSTGDFTPIDLGGHHLVIKAVEETRSKGGRAMLKVSFDMAKNDRQAGYMTNEYKNDIRPDKKWPHAGTQYILTEDNEGNCSKSFKSFITSFEKSNNCSAVWGDKFAAQFKGKRIGGVFGEVENEYNGKTSMRHELRYFCDDSKADAAGIPQPKYLPNTNRTAPAPDSSGFMAIPDGAGDEIPF